MHRFHTPSLLCVRELAAAAPPGAREKCRILSPTPDLESDSALTQDPQVIRGYSQVRKALWV